MLVAPRPEPVAEPQELRLVHWRQDRNHRRLDDLVFQCSNAERPLSAIALRYVLPARGQRSIRSRVNSMMETCEVRLQILHVLGPRHLIDTARGRVLESEHARPQPGDADVMQERRELSLFVPGNGFSYAGLRS